MNSDFESLLELQDVDIQIIELEKSKEEFPVQVDMLGKEVSDAESSLTNKEEELNECLEEKKNIEEQIVNAKASLEKSQERLNLIKTNKEYDAVHTEIETQKHILASADKRIKKYTADIEYLQEVFEEAKGEYNEIITKNQPQIDELKSRIAGIDSEIAKVKKKRDKAVLKVNKNHLRIYDHIRLNRKNGRVISIVDDSRRNCTICYQMLGPQVIHDMRKGSDIVYCQSCGSILVW
jgi:predicted  nucleic acid-binding Zn-ribbon protein